MNAIGLCHHNNLGNACPSCVREKNGMKGMGRLGSYSDFAGMGACPEGYYEASVFGIKTGQCVPNLSTLVEGAQSGALETVGTGVAQSPATAQAAQNAAASAIGTKIVNFYKNNPAMAWGATAAVAALLVYGGMSFIRGR